MSGCPNVIYMPGICFLHMYNAAVKQGLELVDSLLNGLFSKDTLAGFTKYFGSISKVVNCWREQASNIMMAWDEDYQREDVNTLKLGRRYPLSVVSGRWGSIESAEDYLLLRTRERVVPTVLRVLSKHMKAQSTQPCTPSLFGNIVLYCIVLYGCGDRGVIISCFLALACCDKGKMLTGYVFSHVVNIVAYYWDISRLR